MKIALMQPYLFPYIGYWRLIQAVDKFIVYDDVNFIKRGWINRNRILINGEPRYLNIPLIGASQNKKIYEISMQPREVWQKKFLRTLQINYKASPFFSETYSACEKILALQTDNLSDLLVNQIQVIAERLNIDTDIQKSSRYYNNSHLKAQKRVLDICRIEQANIYVNPPNGRSIYESLNFSLHGIDLRFIDSEPVRYEQRSETFIPDLSIIDLLMELGFERLKINLNDYSLQE